MRTIIAYSARSCIASFDRGLRVNIPQGQPTDLSPYLAKTLAYPARVTSKYLKCVWFAAYNIMQVLKEAGVDWIFMQVDNIIRWLLALSLSWVDIDQVNPNSANILDDVFDIGACCII